MKGMSKSLNCIQSDSVVEAVSARSCTIVLETCPPDYVQKVSRYLESSVGQSRQDKVFNDQAEEESDSGDSLFITQKPVPEAVRSGRRHYAPTSPRDLEESEDDVSSSSHEESKTHKKRARKKFVPPKYTFPFLKEVKKKPWNTLLPVQQNRSLHNATMGGFFKCVRELWQGYERGHDLGPSLQTLDMNGEYISPLSKEQEEMSEDEDIKVVEKKRFVAPSKAKCSQPWYTPSKKDSQVKQQRRRTRRRATSQEMSLENQKKGLPKISAKASLKRVTLSSPDTDNSDDGDPSCGVLVERNMSGTSIFTQTETPKTERHVARVNKKILFGKKEQEEEMCDDSDATVCEPPKLQRSPGGQTLRGSEADITVTETQAHAFHTDDLSQTGQEEDEPKSQSLLQGPPELVSNTSNDSVCNETRVKKKKKKSIQDHMRVEEGNGQSREEQEGLHAAASVNMEAEETPSPPGDNRAKAPALHDDNILREEERDIADSAPLKRKRRKNKSEVENIRQEVDGNLESDVILEDSGFSVTLNMENSDEVKKRKKKKKKRGKTSVEDVEQLQSSAITAEPLHEDGEMQREKKQRKKETRIAVTEKCEEVDCLENAEASQETSKCHEKKRQKRKNKQQSSSLEDCVDVSLYNGINFVGHTGLSKNKKIRESICEGVDISYSPDKRKKVENADDQDAEQIIKKKKKKGDKMSEICTTNVLNDTVGQRDDPESVRKKKRTPSFLDADSEENNTQWHQQQSSSPTSASAHVWCAENPGVSTGNVDNKSAEIAGNSNGGVRKKKKKRKTLTTQENVEDDHEPEFEEANRKCQSAFYGSTDTGLKREKKLKRTETDSVIPIERLDSRTDEGQTQVDEAVVPKKKKKKKANKELH